MKAAASIVDFEGKPDNFGALERDFRDYSIDVYQRMGFSDERALIEIYDLYAQVLGNPKKTRDYISEEVADLVRWQVSPNVSQASNGLDQERKTLRVLDGLARIVRKYPPKRHLEAVLQNHVGGLTARKAGFKK